MDWFNEPMLALYGTLFGGVGLKVIEWLTGRKGARTDDATTLRVELRQEIIALRDEAHKLKTEAQAHDDEADAWRSRYFSLIAAVAGQDEEAIKKHFKA